MLDADAAGGDAEAVDYDDADCDGAAGCANVDADASGDGMVDAIANSPWGPAEVAAAEEGARHGA